jgi:hypothetical protein
MQPTAVVLRLIHVQHLRRPSIRRLTLTAGLVFAVAACSSSEKAKVDAGQTACSARPTVMLIQVDASAAAERNPLDLRGCSPVVGCMRRHVPGPAGDHLAEFPYDDTTAQPSIVVPLRLTIRDREDRLTRANLDVPVHQDVSIECGNYGGIGHVVLTRTMAVIARPSE